MRAVNLIPADQRRGGGAPGRSGPGVYVVLGVLAAMVFATGAYVLSSNQVTSNQAKLADTEQEASSLEQQAALLKPYRDFATLSEVRVRTVAQLAESRFDWERVMRELSRALPADVWLTSLVGTVAPGVNVDSGGGGGGTGSLRSALPLPAVEIIGCAEGQSDVSRVMARLRTLNGVQRVSLASSEKSESAAGAPAGGGASSTDCRNGSTRFPQFQIVVFFAAPKGALGATPQGASPGPAPAAGAAAPTAPVSSGAAK